MGPADPLRERDYAQALADLARKSAGHWLGEHLPGYPVPWLFYFRPGVGLPRQGWKLHLSCSTADSVEMLERLAPILLEARSPFKLPTTLEGVTSVNFGAGGEAQLGKILTIYTIDEADFAELGRSLVATWRNARGPWVATDVALSPPGRVFARWGAFVEDARIDRCGRTKLYVDGPDGHSVEDERRLDGAQPSWATRPSLPLAAEASMPRLHSPEPLVGERRYVSLGMYPSRAGTAVSLVLDVDSLETAILKRGRRGAMSDPHGRDVLDRLRNECDVLREIGLADPGFVPRVIAREETNETLTMVQSELAGPTLAQLDPAARVSSLPLLVDAVAELHGRGHVHRDIKLGNAVRLSDRVALIDFELAGRIGSEGCVIGGTPGYTGPEGSIPLAAVGSDSFALGATIFEALTNLPPALVPGPARGGRMAGILARLGRPVAGSLVRNLTRDDRVARAAPSDLHADGLWGGQRSALGAQARLPRARPGGRRSRTWARCAFEAGQRVRAFERSVDDGTTWSFIDDNGMSLGESLYSGAAGTVLGLRMLGNCLGHGEFHRQAHTGSLQLASRIPQEQAHGLFTGNAGVALALALVGTAENDHTLLEAAGRRLRFAATADFDDPDLFSGSAGIVWAGVLIAEIVQELWPLSLVGTHAQALRQRVDRDAGSGVCCWPSCDSYDPERRPYFGVAHGSAGIALALGAWGGALDDDASRSLALETFSGLGACLAERTSLPEGPGRSLMPTGMWCHGATGLVWALLRVADALPDVEELLASMGPRLLSDLVLPVDTNICHGIGGVLDVVHGLRSRGIAERLADDHAQCLSDILVFLSARTGRTRDWPLMGSNQASPGLVQGFLGPATELAVSVTPTGGGFLSGTCLS